MSETYKLILYRVADRVARITLNTPEERNALSFLIHDEIVGALRAAELNSWCLCRRARSWAQY
jgi:enoyl-CoA hydratase